MSTEALEHHEAKEEALALLELKHGSAYLYPGNASASVRSPSDLGNGLRPAPSAVNGTSKNGTENSVEKRPPTASIRVGEVPYVFNKFKVNKKF